jgi:hypothetical protein
MEACLMRLPGLILASRTESEARNKIKLSFQMRDYEISLPGRRRPTVMSSIKSPSPDGARPSLRGPKFPTPIAIPLLPRSISRSLKIRGN